MLYHILLLYYFGDSASFAAPLPVNTTALYTEIAEPWTPNPSGRGTWDVLYSCTFTLVLCVWTSIHLNVPPPGDTAWTVLWRKIKWVLIALFAPEIVVFVAFQQWLTALTFKRELNRLAKKYSKEIKKMKLDLEYRNKKYRYSKNKEISEKMEKGEQNSAFDLYYAYFVAMGGFVVDISHLHNSLQRVTITPNGVLLLASQGKFFHPSVETIKDKSKANVFAKLLVCIQVLWIAGQTLERWIAGYPLTLLEIHTIVHIVCALTMYLLWFQKPLDVEDPTTIPSENIEDILAFMVTSTQWKKDSGFKNSKRNSEGQWTQIEGHFLGDPPLHWYRNWKPINTQFPIVEHLLTSPIPQKDKRVRLQSDQAEGVETVTYLEAIEQADDRTLVYSVKNIQCTYTPLQRDVRCTLVSGQALSCGLGPAVSYVPPKALDGASDADETKDKITTKLTGENINEREQKLANHLRHAYLHFQNGYRRKHSKISDPLNCSVSLSEVDTQRLKLASTFIANLIESAKFSNAVTVTHSTLDTEAREHSISDSQNVNINQIAFPTDRPFNPFTNDSLQRYGSRLLSIREQNWTSALDLLDSFDYFGRSGVLFMSFMIAVAFCFIPGAYGVVHYAALGTMFPSDIEELLWKISCYVLLASAALLPAVAVLLIGLVIAVLILISFFWGLGALLNYFTCGWFYGQLEELWKPASRRQANTTDRTSLIAAILTLIISPIVMSAMVVGIAGIFVIPASIFVYIGARLYIVIEAFVSLRRVPIGVYETPSINFMDYIPHF